MKHKKEREIFTGGESVRKAKLGGQKQIVQEGHVGVSKDGFPSCSFAEKPFVASVSDQEYVALVFLLWLCLEQQDLSLPWLSWYPESDSQSHLSSI